MITSKYLVADKEGQTSARLGRTSLVTPEAFSDLDAAQERALEIAAMKPGVNVYIYKMVGVVCARVNEPVLTMEDEE